MTRFDVTTFGESLLRLSVSTGERLELATRFDVSSAGTESNVMAALGQLDHRCGWVSALPDSAVGRIVANAFRLRGIDLDAVVWMDEGRLGTYYLEMASAPRSTQVIYDRKDSCVSKMTSAEINWDYLLDTRLIHLTGITPALSAYCQQAVTDIISRAGAAHIPVSFDINYRGKLWSPDEAAAVLIPMIQGVELLFCRYDDARLLFQCDGTDEEVLQQLVDISQAKQIILSHGSNDVMGWDGTHLHREAPLDVEIIDRIGAGDGLAAGVIHGWLAGDFRRGLRYGTAMAALALSMHGDMITTNQAELDELVQGHQGGVVR